MRFYFRVFLLLLVVFTLVTFFQYVSYNIVSNVSAQTNSGYCAKKYIGDADCKTDPGGKSVTIMDYAIWYSEFIKGCSSTNLSGCGLDSDGDGYVMDANFNYLGTNYIITDSKVDVFDYAVWIQGFLADTATTPTSTTTPTGVVITPPAGSGGTFPGAEGYGSRAKGGKGGRVIFVTNLNDSGIGSLRECMQASGARTCIFQVGGTIILNSRIDVVNPFLTVAGQSAPGDGIQIRMASTSGGDAIKIATNNVIIRYITIRPGTTGVNSRALTIGTSSSASVHPSDVMIDHISTSWSEDEQIAVWYNSRNVTIQNSIMAQGIGSQNKGPNLGGSGSDDPIGGPYTFYGNIVAQFMQRMPRLKAASPQGGVTDLVNNVIYNPVWTGGDYNGAYISAGAKVNAIGNYVKVASGTVPYYLYISEGQVYAKGNITPGRKTDSGSEWAGVVSGPVSATQFIPSTNAMPVSSPKSAQAAYDQALAQAGNSAALTCTGSFVARRDRIDADIVGNIRNSTGKLISSPSEVGGWPTYANGTACPDTDYDGMPDTWEMSHGLSVGTADHNMDPDRDGYTNLEEYLNGTIPQ